MRPRTRIRIFLARWNYARRTDWMIDRLDAISQRLFDVDDRTAAIADRQDTQLDVIRALNDVQASVYDNLRSLIMATFAQTAADLDHVTTEIADRMAVRDHLIAELRDAVAAQDIVRAQALAAQDQEHANITATILDRLRGIGVDPENPLPDTTPLPTPETPAPLVPPADEPVVVEPAPSPDVPAVEPDAPLAVPSPGEPSDVGPVDDTVIGEPGDERA